MRTKHIFTAMVLPALFAACTADDFEVVNNGTTDSQRPMLSGVTLNVVGDADTRYAVDDNGSSLKFTYENGDRIGASIIDNVKTEYGKVTDPSEWPIQQYQNGISNPFVYDARTDSWSSINSVGVGHYIFMYPYSEENINRKAVSYNLPVIQELYDEDGTLNLNAAIAKGNQSIYSDLLLEDDLVVDAYMRNLFAYPTFRVNIDNGQEVNTVSQIVLEYEDGFRVKGGLNHQKVWGFFSKEDTKWNNLDTEDFLLDVNNEFIPDQEGQTSKYLIAKFPEGTQFLRNSNTQNKYIDVRFMIPSAVMTANTDENVTTFADGYTNKLKMHIYTDNGVYTISNIFASNKNDAAVVFKETTDFDIRGRVVARNTSYTLNLDKSKAKLGTEKFIVTTTKDWNDLVDRYGASKNYSGGLNISVIGDEFSLNADTKFPTVAIFKVDTEVKVTGNVTVKNVEVANTVIVEKGAALTTTESFKAQKIENKGTLNITKVLNDDDEVVPYEVIIEIVNKGTLNVEEDAEASFELTNEEDATVTNNGDITINGSNNGTITNDGIIRTTGFVNESRGYDDDNKKVINTPTITNNAGARIVAQEDELINKALIVNNGELTCQNEYGKIFNDEDINGKAAELRAAKAPALTYITDNVNGKVVVYEAKPANLTISEEGKVGVVEYTTSAAAENFTNSLVNTVIASADYNVQGGKLTTLTIKATAKLTVATSATIANLNINAGITTLASNVTVGNKLKVAEGAQVTVPTNTTLTVSNQLDNKGRILVGGTLNATKVNRGEAGNVENNGGKINFAPTKEEVAQADYEEALVTAVAYYMNNAGNYTKDSYEVKQTSFLSSYNYWLENDTPEAISILKEKMDAAGKTTVTDDELEAAVASVEADADNQKKLVEALKKATLDADAMLYDTKDAYKAATATTEEVTAAYHTFRASVITGNIVTVANSVKRTVNSMTTADIDELLAEKKPTMYIWEGCDLDKVVALWKQYDGKLGTSVDGYEFSDITLSQNGYEGAASLIQWLTTILNTSSTGTPAIATAQSAIAALGITIDNVDDYTGYTNYQIKACAEAE